MDQPKFERMLRLIKMMTGNTSLTIDDMARRLDTTYRSIYRYIDTFKDAGFVVLKVGPGVYQLVSVNKKVPDLTKIIYFSDEEAAVLNQLIERLDNSDALKQNLQKKLAAVYECAPATDFIDRKSNAMNVRELSEAIRGRRQAVLRGYKSSHSETTRDRRVEPFALTTNHVQLWAYDLEDGTCKIFSVSHIGEVEVLQEVWEHERDHRKKQTYIFRMFDEEHYHVRLELGQRAANCLRDEYPLSEPYLTADGDKWILDTEVCGLRGVGRFVIGLADDIRILDAPELAEYVQEFAGKNIPVLLKHQ